MKKHFKVELEGKRTTIAFIPPDDIHASQMAIHVSCNGTSADITFHSHSPVEWGLLHRAIGHIIDTLQPGVVSPLPDDSPDLVDALKVRHEIDRLWREGNNE